MQVKQIKLVDARGRITIGMEYAGKAIVFEKTGPSEMKIDVAAVIPEKELWLYKNPEAMKALLTGIEQAKAGIFSETPPDIDADDSWLDEIED